MNNLCYIPTCSSKSAASEEKYYYAIALICCLQMYRISDSPSKQSDQICFFAGHWARSCIPLTDADNPPPPSRLNGPIDQGAKNDHPIMRHALAFLILRDIKHFYRILYFCLWVEEQRPIHPSVTSVGILFFFFGSVSYKKHVTSFVMATLGQFNLKYR